MKKNSVFSVMMLLFLGISVVGPTLASCELVKPTHMDSSDFADADELRVLMTFADTVPPDVHSELNVVYEYQYLSMILVKDAVSRIGEYVAAHANIVTHVVEDEPFSFNPTDDVDELDSTSTDSLDPDSAAAIMDADKLWDLGFNGTGVTIGVMDTGINYHQDFDPNLDGSMDEKIIAAESFVRTIYGYSNDIPDTIDRYGHGTAITGIAAGTGYAGGGAWPGIAPGAEIVFAKVWGETDPYYEETPSGLIAAMEWLVSQGADIITFSGGQYLNLPISPVQFAINTLAVNQHVVFTVAAGNSATSRTIEGNYYWPIDGATLNNPSTALQAISVAGAYGHEYRGRPAGSMASWSSTGSKSDYSMKPDITASGQHVEAPHNRYPTRYRRYGGTSSAAPQIAGASALLIQYLRSIGVSYTTGTIKAALMAGARDLDYPSWSQGSGYINVSRAYEVLRDSPKVESLTKLGYLHPSRGLPYDPTRTLFQGQWITYNMTLINSGTSTYTLTTSGNASAFIQAINTIEATDSTLFEVTLSIPGYASTGFYTGTLTVGDNVVSSSIDVNFEVKKPVAKVLFDEYHSTIVYHSDFGDYGAPYRGIAGDTNFMYGMFKAYAHMLMENNVLFQPFNKPLTEIRLKDYDAIIIPDPATYHFDPFEDWICSYFAWHDPNEVERLSSAEIEAIQKYVSKGGGLLIATQGIDTCYVPATNELINTYGIQLNTDDMRRVSVTEIAPHTFASEIVSYTHTGPSLTITQDAFAIAEYDEKIVMAGWQGRQGGRVLVIGSDYPFDNYRFNGRDVASATDENEKLSLLATEWVAYIVTLPAILNVENELEELRDTILAQGLNEEIETSLIDKADVAFVKVQQSLAYFTEGDTAKAENMLTVASSILYALLSQVEAQRGIGIEPSLADDLALRILQIIRLIPAPAHS